MDVTQFKLKLRIWSKWKYIQILTSYCIQLYIPCDTYHHIFVDSVFRFRFGKFSSIWFGIFGLVNLGLAAN